VSVVERLRTGLAVILLAGSLCCEIDGALEIVTRRQILPWHVAFFHNRVAVRKFGKCL